MLGAAPGMVYRGSVRAILAALVLLLAAAIATADVTLTLKAFPVGCEVIIDGVAATPLTTQGALRTFRLPKALFFIGLGDGLAQFISAIYQGEASAAGISLLARRPEAAGKAVLFPAFVETYAVVALLATILFIIFLTQPVMLQFLPK